MAERGSCFRCVHFRKESESWEMPHVRWYECAWRPMNENLKSWPWKRTACKGFQEVEAPHV